MHVRILGPVGVVDRGRLLPLGGPKERTVVATLALSAGHVVSEDRLIDALWGEGPPRTASKTLHTYVSRVRKVLASGTSGDGGVVDIETRFPGYVLLVGPDGLDVARVERLLHSAREAASRGDHASAAALLHDAANYWHGPPLEDFADQPFAVGARTRLEELRMSVVEERLESELALGRHVTCVPELEALVSLHPLRERIWAQLIVALYRSHRQADALRAYQRARTALVEALGIEPAAGLRQLERAVIAQDPSLDLDVVAAAAVAGHGGRREPAAGDLAAGTRLGNLPHRVTSFVGRDDEVAAVLDALDQSRIVTLTGPGGVGKTRLALEVADAALARHPDGVWLCQLAPLEDGEAAGRAVATALNVQQAAGRSIVESIVEAVRGRRLLLVLDNGEHLIGALADLVEAIVRFTPWVAVLVTSRAPLGMEGERVRQIAPLEVPGALDAVDPDDPGRYPAVAMFLDRARAAQPRFALTAAHAEGVKEICRRLDGVPLALELAAARTRSMTPAEIAERLDRPFQLLSGTRRTGHGVQRTLRETVDWSYGLLAVPEQRLFNRLAVFAGGFSLDAAEVVGPGPLLDEEDVAETLVDLVDKSMVVAEQCGTATRYRLLETLREYGHERLEEAGESAAWARRHAEYFVSFAEDAAPHVCGRDEARWVHRLDQEFYNLRAAHSWAVAAGDTDKAFRLVAALRTFAMWGMRYEVATWADRALGMAEAARHPLLPVVLGSAAYGAWARGAFKDAIRLGELGLAAERDLGTPPSWLPRNLLTHLAMFERRFEDAYDHVQVNVTLARDHGERYELAYALWLKASVVSALGDAPRAVEVAEQALRLARDLGNPTAIAASLHELGREFRVKDPQQAMALFRESERVARSVDNRLAVGMATRELTAMSAVHDDPGHALQAYPGAIDYWYRAGDWWNQWITLRKLAVLLLQLGRVEPAAVLQAAATAAHPSRPVTPGHLDRMATLEARLGSERFAAATARGASMVPDEVLAYARTEIEKVLASTTPATGRVVHDRKGGRG